MSETDWKLPSCKIYVETCYDAIANDRFDYAWDERHRYREDSALIITKEEFEMCGVVNGCKFCVDDDINNTAMGKINKIGDTYSYPKCIGRTYIMCPECGERTTYGYQLDVDCSAFNYSCTKCDGIITVCASCYDDDAMDMPTIGIEKQKLLADDSHDAKAEFESHQAARLNELYELKWCDDYDNMEGWVCHWLNRRQCMKSRTKRKTRKYKRQKGGQTKKHKSKGSFKKLNCNPTTKFRKTADQTCYDDSQLKYIRSLWNVKHPDDKIDASASSATIWALLKKKYQAKCNDEKCWIDELKKGSGNDGINSGTNMKSLKNAFAPDAPEEWKKNPNAWLSDKDINDVMKQYEQAYKMLRVHRAVSH